MIDLNTKLCSFLRVATERSLWTGHAGFQSRPQDGFWLKSFVHLEIETSLRLRTLNFVRIR